MSRRKRTLLIAAAVVLAALLLAPAALAAAGGGSAGFGGGGGGGEGGGGGGGGGGFGVFILIQLLIRIAVLGHGLGALVLIALAIAYLIITRVAPGATRAWSAQSSKGRAQRRRVAQRQRRVQAAAAEAAEDDAAFAADAVKVNATALFKQVQAAWDRGDRAALQRLVGPKLSGEWDRRLDDLDRHGWRNRVQILGEPQVEYVGLNHKGDAQTDTVTVRVEAKLRDYVEDRLGNHVKRAGHLSETVHLREFWTLGRRNGRWMLVSIEQGAEGMHAIDEAIVATTWSDNTALRDEALIEGAVQDAVPENTNIAEVADLDFKGDAHAAALDLSLADGRFAPDVLEVTARRAVSAWAEAVDGDAARLRSIAHGQAVRDLLHPGDPSQRTRLVVRGPQVTAIRITGLDAAAQPPTMTIEVQLQGRRYIEDRDTTAVVAGSLSHHTKFTEHWTFTLDGDSRQPWLLAAVASPVPQG
ncbi:MAG TPA: TIM44-like domain-containing protein [Solirubrobacteraceae bacterium]|nr:TIM44-like domain-containing protein [Solirubrobacteraceae bacterium]